jgi:uncharacterized alkaline shock family protein YloU
MWRRDDMNVFNRAMTILLFLTLMIVVPIVMVLPDAVIALLQQFLSTVSSTMNNFHRVILILLGVISFLICGLVLYLEFRRPPRRRVKLQKISGGEVELAVESIAQRLEYRVDQLADVVRVRPDIKARRNSVDVELNLETTPDIDVPTKTEEVCQVVRDVVEERMGLELGKIKVNIKHAPYPDVS